MGKAESIARIQKWYSRQCDGDREHGWGVSISTLDNLACTRRSTSAMRLPGTDVVWSLKRDEEAGCVG
jgi:hypothetical protein